MAYGKRKYSQRLPYGAYKFGQSMARQLRFQKRQEALQEAALAASAVASTAGNNLQLRRDAAIAMGRGAYGLGDKIRRMASSKLGKAVRRGVEYGINQSPFASDYQGLKAAVAPRGSGLYTGMGSYQSNDLIDGNLNDPVPDFGGDSPEDGIIVSKKEYVGEIYGPAKEIINGTRQMPAFKYQIVGINPGLETCFPWLSQLAANYNEYELIQCIFTFQSTIVESSNTTNGQVGQIVMACQYNTSLPPYQSMQQMLQAASPSRGKITENQYQGIECDPSANSGSAGKYIRTGPIPPTTSDASKYDVGFLQIGLCNIDQDYENVSLGQLYISYTVRLRKPRLMTTLGNTITKDIFLSNGGETTGALFGTINAKGSSDTLLQGQQNNLNSKLSFTAMASQLGTTSMITFPANYSGTLRVLLSVTFSTASCLPITNWSSGANPCTSTGNVYLVEDLYGPQSTSAQDDLTDGPSTFVVSQGTGGYLLSLHVRVEVATNGTDNTLSIPVAFTAAFPLGQAYLEISEYNASFSGKSLNINTDDAPCWVTVKNKIITEPSNV